MKRTLIGLALAMMPILLSACGNGSAAATASAADSGAGTAPVQGELSTAAVDLLGIFKLEGTELAVDSAQAAALLPLWQAYRSLLSSDSAASAEVEALKLQIDEALTAEQTSAIAAMNLTAQDLFAMADELGVTQGQPSVDRSDSSTGRPGFEFGGGPGQGPSFSGGDMPAPPSGGGGFVMGGESGDPPDGFDPSMMAGGTPQPGQGARAGQGDRLSQLLLDPLIELLKERAGA